MLKSYIEYLQSNGRYWFTKSESLSWTNISNNAFKASCSRLYKKKQLNYLGHQFFIIIPLEYRNLEAPPPSLYIDPFMKHLKLKYYVALLSSAAIHGSTHQQPQIFQVIVEKHIDELIVGRSKIKFYQYKQIVDADIEQIKVSTGIVQVSSKVQTIFDLLRFPKESGYLDNVARVIIDIAEEIDTKQFQKHVYNEPNNAILQRLGYICDIYDLTELSDILFNEVMSRNSRYTPLRPELSQNNAIVSNDICLPQNSKWHIIINDQIEVDE